MQYVFDLFVGDYCKDYNDSSIPHLSNCNLYVQCLKKVPFGKPCQPNLCFGITQTVVCDFCTNAICPSEITTTLQPESTVPVESIDVSCTDSTVQLNTGPGVITCTVNAISFSMMNVTYKNKIRQLQLLLH
ncbi:uncharacterized protein LOC143066762 [Mytilus galloprovincialis]|uniref:uncharacterized protein LOC143066762 n=1 Tax=Mytilus galloprovincialis TaxID=29158 RepID=UPI003F7BB3B2